MFRFFNVGYLLNRDLVTLLRFNKNPTADLCAWAAARLCLLRHIWPSLSASRWPRITFTWPCRAIATSQWQSPHSTTWVRIQPRPQRSWPWELTALTLLSHHSISSMCCLDKTARHVSKQREIKSSFPLVPGSTLRSTQSSGRSSGLPSETLLMWWSIERSVNSFWKRSRLRWTSISRTPSPTDRYTLLHSSNCVQCWDEMSQKHVLCAYTGVRALYRLHAGSSKRQTGHALPRSR